ncbi:hypothetical protein BDR06DRAFT_968996 [Suillus hirtellus]|nr:hypothetical protein BDR06DRAFT_968996 [Suillus hirtellus]
MKPRNAALHVSDSNKRKAGNEDSDVAVIADGPKSAPLSRSRQKRKKKFQSTDEDKVHTRIILVKAKSDKDLNLVGIDSVANDRNFWEKETRGGVRILRLQCCGSVGVKERLQAKMAAALSNSDKHSGARIPKSWAIFQTPAGCSSWKTASHGSSGLRHKETAYLEAGQQPKDVPSSNMLMQPLPTVSTLQPIPWLEQDNHPAPTNNIDP